MHTNGGVKRSILSALLAIAVILSAAELLPFFVYYSEDSILRYHRYIFMLLDFLKCLGVVVLLVYWKPQKPKLELVVLLLTMLIPIFSAIVISFLPSAPVEGFQDLFGPGRYDWIQNTVKYAAMALRVAILILLYIKAAKKELLVLVPFTIYFVLDDLLVSSGVLSRIFMIGTYVVLIVHFVLAVVYMKGKESAQAMTTAEEDR